MRLASSVSPRPIALALPLLAAALACASDDGGARKEDASSTSTTPAGPAATPAVGKLSDEIPLGAYTVRGYASTPDHAAVNAFLVYTKDELVLIDTALVNSEATALADHIAALGVPLKTIFITHGHPDHFMGLSVLTKRFPDAEVLARPYTIAVMKESFARYEALLEKFFPGDVAHELVEPKPLADTFFKVGGAPLEILDFADGESKFTSVVVFSQFRMAFVGDMAYNNVHPWLNEMRPDGVLQHIEALRLLPNAETLFVGHGGPMTKADLFQYERYVRTFLEEVEASSSAEELVSRMSDKFPDYVAPAGLRFSAQAFIGEKAKRAAGGG